MTDGTAGAARRDLVAGVTDQRCPPLSDLLKPYGINAREFKAWLAPMLGHYRAHLAARDAFPAPAAEVEALRHVGRSLDAAAAALRLSTGPRGDAHLAVAAMRMGLDWTATRKRMARDLAQAQALFAAAEGRLAGVPAKRGRRSDGARAQLLHAVIERLKTTPMRAHQAQELAVAVLWRCGVKSVPAASNGDTRALRRAAKVKD